jgi:hypothetical protein
MSLTNDSTMALKEYVRIIIYSFLLLYQHCCANMEENSNFNSTRTPLKK